MADLTYIVRVDHKAKGIGYTARKALQNAQRQETSPILRTKFIGSPQSDHTKIEVTINDDLLCHVITSAIESSGRMPSETSSYSIGEIELQKEEGTSNGRLETLARQYDLSQKQVGTLRDENAKLRQGLTPNKAGVISTPLEGLLAYFETTKYSPEFILEAPADVDFARRVFSGDIKNTFVNYVNHNPGENLSPDEVERILDYELKDSDEFSRLCSKYGMAKTELDFLAKLKAGNTDIPETLREDYIKVIEAKSHDETVRVYESAVQEREEVKVKQFRLRQLKEKYDSFSEQIDLLTHAGVDVWSDPRFPDSKLRY